MIKTAAVCLVCAAVAGGVGVTVSSDTIVQMSSGAIAITGALGAVLATYRIAAPSKTPDLTQSVQAIEREITALAASQVDCARDLAGLRQDVGYLRGRLDAVGFPKSAQPAPRVILPGDNPL